MAYSYTCTFRSFPEFTVVKSDAINLLAYVQQFVLDIYLEMTLLGHGVGVRLTFKIMPNCFPKSLYPLTPLPAKHRRF